MLDAYTTPSITRVLAYAVTKAISSKIAAAGASPRHEFGVLGRARIE